MFQRRLGIRAGDPDDGLADDSADEAELATRERLFQELQDKEKAEWKAEEERRHNIGPAGRAREDGVTLLDEINDDEHALVVLEPSASNRARCRAEECLGVEMEGDKGQYITDRFRICVTDRAKTWYDRKRYYHVPCFERMIPIEKLLPVKFSLHEGTWEWTVKWGLMVRRWVENKGRMAPDKIAAYIEAMEQYNKEKDRFFDTVWQPWSVQHRECKTETGMCGCPPEPTHGFEEPVLRGFKTSKEDGCRLAEVLAHPRYQDLGEAPFKDPGILQWQPKEESDGDATGNSTGGEGMPEEQVAPPA